MRPTRWTRKQRRTKPGKGGWSVDWIEGSFLFMYTHPVTGTGYANDHLIDLIRTRRRLEKGEQVVDEIYLTGPVGSREVDKDQCRK